MMATQSAPPDYVLGRSEQESARLIKQSMFVRPSTERVFRKAGIAEGTRVLDIGCGAGDVSFLTAELVGATGSVTGVDRDPAVIALARRRAKENGLSNVNFEESDIDALTFTQPFDAVVSRFVLLYQADPAATLARVARAVKPGGLVVVQEPDFRVGMAAFPTVELVQKVAHWVHEAFRRGGVHHDIGGRLYHVFRQAGLPGPMLLQHVTVAGGVEARASCENITEMVRSLLPRMEKFGVATAEEVQVETLADRLERAATAVDAQVSFIPVTGAWVNLSS